jgi:hypothetical protein
LPTAFFSRSAITSFDQWGDDVVTRLILASSRS